QDISERKQAEIALQKSEERYRQLSTTDSLTGLGNLRSCYEHLEREMARSRRYTSPLSVLLFDVDNFKEYNDTWGHMEGDAALKALAGCVLGNQRVSDSAFRYGGEEFVIILPETTLDQAEILAERIRIDYAGTLLTPAENVTVSCTVSIGIAQFRQEDTAKSFLNRADSGTYQAKADGKNRVVPVA
ncbi:MAG TPA: GGDEF domain-containing protein, partial [Rhodocyclaceae bacterium]|nr:GGDEF domain-containing protein [Rhodocyclaceae bacterium]